MTEPGIEPATSPVLRMGIAVLFLCCAALAIGYAWMENVKAEAKKQKLEESSTQVSTKK